MGSGRLAPVRAWEGELTPSAGAGSAKRTLLDKLRSPSNWRGFIGLLRYARDPIDAIRRYYFRRGSYPCIVGLRTPTRPIALELHSHEDMVTVHEVFFREDYRVPRNIRTAVDFGGNIGVSSAYFLSRNPEAMVHTYEPVPRNIERLKRNLSWFGGRLILNECAVGTENGTVSFGIESSGRYGGIGTGFTERIDVPCRRADEELRRILARHGRIDALKIDVEGMEGSILRALTAAELAGIDRIMAEYETDDIRLPGFTAGRYLSIAQFTKG